MNRYIELNPAHYRWSSYRANALGETTLLLTPHPLYASLDATDGERQAAYRELFNRVLPDKTIGDVQPALNQTQPLGNRRFFDTIEQATGQRREAKRQVPQTGSRCRTEGQPSSAGFDRFGLSSRMLTSAFFKLKSAFSPRGMVVYSY